MEKRRIIWECTAKDAEKLLEIKREKYRKEILNLKEICPHCLADFPRGVPNMDTCLECYAKKDAFDDLLKKVSIMEKKLYMPLDSAVVAIERDRDGKFTLPYSLSHYTNKCNLNAVLCLAYLNNGDSPDSYILYSNGVNIRVIWKDMYCLTEHDILLRKLKKEYPDADFKAIMRGQDYILTKNDINKYTESLLPYMKKKLKWN